MKGLNPRIARRSRLRFRNTPDDVDRKIDHKFNLLCKRTLAGCLAKPGMSPHIRM
jgi:hypothetical protein